MSRSRSENRMLLRSAMLFLASVVMFAWAISALISAGESQGLLWPNDINRSMATMLGGTVTVDSTGKQLPTVGTFSVLLRLLAVSCTATALIWFLCRRMGQQERRVQMANILSTSSYAMLAGAAWWLLWFCGSLGLPAVADFAARVLPLWLMISLAVWAWDWLDALLFASGEKPAPRLVTETQTGASALRLVMICAAAWAAVSFWMNYRLYENLLIPHGDSAMYEEHLWNVWHGKGFRSYLDQGLFFGEHIQVIHLLLLPLHILWPSHLLLELAESIALAGCSIPIYSIVKRHTKNSMAAALLGVAWLFYFPMHFLDISIDQKTFRPIVLGLPFLFWLIDFVERRRFVAAAVCLLLVLSAKEDMALIAFPLLVVLGVMAQRGRNRKVDGLGGPSYTSRSGIRENFRDKGFWRNPLRFNEQRHRAAWWCFGMAGFSAAYLLLAVLIVIPAFRAGDAVHYSRYFGDLGSSPGELIRTTLTQPAKVLAQVVSLRTLLYGITFLGPLAFVPLRRTALLLAGGLTFVMLSLMQLSDGDAALYPVPYHHFHAPLLPVLFWMTAAALSRLGRCSVRWPSKSAAKNPKASEDHRTGIRVESAALLVLLCCVFTSLTSSTTPYGLTFWSAESPFGHTALYTLTDPAMVERAAMAKKVSEQIPKTARVASTDFIHTRLTHCERSYDYSDYLRAVNNYQKVVPPDTDYIVIDTGHRYSTIRRAEDVPELQAENSEWRLLPDTTNGHFLVLKWRGQD